MFAARHDLAATVDALAVLVRELVFDAERLADAAADPHLLASDAAEPLVEDGVPFRDAHEQVASDVLDGSFTAPDAPTPPLSPGPGATCDGDRRSARAGSAARPDQLARALALCLARVLAGPAVCDIVARATVETVRTVPSDSVSFPPSPLIASLPASPHSTSARRAGQTVVPHGADDRAAGREADSLPVGLEGTDRVGRERRDTHAVGVHRVRRNDPGCVVSRVNTIFLPSGDHTGASRAAEDSSAGAHPFVRRRSSRYRSRWV